MAFLRTIQRAAALCRGGVTFVNKMDQFIWRAQSVCYTMHNIIVMCSTLTAIFASAIEASRLSKDVPPKSFDADDAKAFSLTCFEV